MSVGVRYTFPHDVYPRYGYLRSWTKRLFKTFKEHIESNDLDDCVCDGYTNLENIKEAEQCLQKPIVTVFAQKRSLVLGLGKALVKSLEPFQNKKLISEVVSWNDFIQDGEKDKEHDSKILVVIAKGTDLEISKKLSKLTQIQKENTFIYDPSTRDHRLFMRKSNDLPETKSLQRSLSGDIQSVLELKVVMVMEKIASYIVPLVPMESTEPDKSLLDYIADDMQQLDKFGLEELLTELEDRANKDLIKKLSKAEEKERFRNKLNSEEMQKLGKLVGRRVKCKMIEYLSWMYGIHCMVTTTFFSDKFFNFEDKFAIWISKGKENQIETILKKCETDISHFIHDVASFIQQKYELLEIVRRHQFELHGLLRQSNFKVNVMVEMKLNPELQDKLLNVEEVTGCGTIYGLLTLHASSELTQSSKENIKQILQKYNYHKGYKVQFVTSNSKHAGAVRETFNKVENGFLLISEYAKTGATKTTKEGTLGCFVEVKQKSSTPQQNEHSKETQTKVKIENEGNQSALKINSNTPNPYGKHPQQKMSTENGKSAVKTIGDEQKPCGDNTQQRSRENSLERKSELHCITCAHCVTDCKNEITTGDNKPFALQTGLLIENGERYDIALLKICENRREECSIHKMRIKDKKGREVVRYPWRMYQPPEGLAGRPVYKFGSNLIHYTHGVIASDNFKTITKKIINGATNLLHAMDPAVNIIIGSVANVQFSTEGDSGSVICDRDINECFVEGIAILHGQIATVGGKWLYSYAALLKSSFQKLEDTYAIEIRVPDSQRNFERIFGDEFQHLTLQEGAEGGEILEVTEGHMPQDDDDDDDAEGGELLVFTERNVERQEGRVLREYAEGVEILEVTEGNVIMQEGHMPQDDADGGELLVFTERNVERQDGLVLREDDEGGEILEVTEANDIMQDGRMPQDDAEGEELLVFTERNVERQDGHMPQDDAEGGGILEFTQVNGKRQKRHMLQDNDVGVEAMKVIEGNVTMQKENMLQDYAVEGEIMKVTEENVNKQERLMLQDNTNTVNGKEENMDAQNTYFRRMV